MRKMLSGNNMTNYGAGFLLSTYFVVGIALVPMLAPSTPSNFQKVFFAECHWGCAPGTGGKTRCVRQYICTSQSKKGPVAYQSTTGPTGSTGPTKPVPPKTNRAYH
jgi:hypothetical protein